MGEPADLTPEERHYFVGFARRVVDSEVNDEDQPQPAFLDGDAMPDDLAIFKLCQLLLEQDLSCVIVKNGGPYQIYDDCVHVAKKEWDATQAELADLKAKVAAMSRTMGALV
ncbi:MAG TPA: hypothetical protein VF488_12575 [Gemmatimonadaceae bacterium]